MQLTWQPAPAECVKRAQVAPKALAGAAVLLQFHEEQLEQGKPAEQDYHKSMIEHYRLLLERWGTG